MKLYVGTGRSTLSQFNLQLKLIYACQYRNKEKEKCRNKNQQNLFIKDKTEAHQYK